MMNAGMRNAESIINKGSMYSSRSSYLSAVYSGLEAAGHQQLSLALKIIYDLIPRYLAVPIFLKSLRN